MYLITHNRRRRAPSFMGMFSVSEHFWIQTTREVGTICASNLGREHHKIIARSEKDRKTTFGQIPATLFLKWPRVNIEATQNGKHLYQSHKLCEAGGNNDQGARFWRLVLYPQTWSTNIMNQHSTAGPGFLSD